MTGNDFSLRPRRPSDLDFLREVYASTRAEEMALVPWTSKEKADFVRFQFEAQHSYYLEHFPDARYLVVELGSVPAGRLYVDPRETEFRVIDIALLPQHRGKGLGGRLMKLVLDEASSQDKPVRIHVEINNPALRLYERLGFQPVEDFGVYRLMEWLPEQRKANAGQADA